MKHYNILIISISTLAALVSCTREELQETDSAIRFSVTATAGQAGLPPTRTSYGDLAASVSGLTKTILWAEGDRVSLWSPDAVVMQSGAVTHPAASYSVGEQGVSPVTGSTPLQWGTADTHVFYGKYPDPTWASAAPHANDAFAAQDPASASFQCWLPSTVTVTPAEGVNAYSEDMAYCYMTAYASVPRNAAVDMVFKQAVSAFHITIPHGFTELSVSKVELSSASHRLNGAFSIDIADTPTFNVPEVDLTDADKKVSFEFASPYSVPPGYSLDVTLFTCPVEMNDLTLMLTTPSGVSMTLPLMTAAGESLSFPAGKYFDIACNGLDGVSSVHSFTVDSLGLKVFFAPGNLQYTKSTDKWSFMEHQYSTVEINGLDPGGAGRDVGENYANQDVVSLFGWGTSGYDGCYPYLTTYNASDYGPEWRQDLEIRFPDEYDWGKHNTIVNGGGYSWRTLTWKEMEYVINNRKIGGTNKCLCALAQVVGVPGLLLFPDDFDAAGSNFRFMRTELSEWYGEPSWSYSDVGEFSDNIVDADAWAQLEYLGCVFLPASGDRYGTYVWVGDGGSGSYWTSSYDQWFDFPNFSWGDYDVAQGRSVRLVREVSKPVFRFTAGDAKWVAISSGNLQYIGSASTPYWKFADHQWDILGTTTGQDSDATNVDRDLFGWATSGYNGKNPYMTSTQASDYGPTLSTYYYEWTSDSSEWDWGLHNSISNADGYTWRTPTSSEWYNILYYRGASPKFAMANVAGVNGIIVFPDRFARPSVTVEINNPDAGSDGHFSDNTFDADTWSVLEKAGCIFLPAAGYRDGTTVSGLGDYCLYWSSTSYYNDADYRCISDPESSDSPSIDRSNGISVRLVRDL